MTIRSKLAWTFILLLIFGITAISSYSIVFIRDYLLEQGQIEIKKDTRWLATSIESLPEDEKFSHRFNEAGEISGYQIALYDSEGKLISTYPDTISVSPFLSDDIQITLQARDSLPWLPQDEESEKLVSYIHVSNTMNPVSYIRVSQYKDRVYEPIKTIRWIIYYGMFISVGLVIIVSIWIARYLTKPITQIKNAASEIAEGDVDRQINLKRNDEFGTLATSLNQMASKLREDTEQIKQYAERQRQFFTDITHEIRNPLHTISASLEMLEMDNLSEEKRKKYHANAKKQVDRISRLFKDLLTLQRYDSDEYFIEKKVFDLSEVGKHMLEWHEEKAQEKGITLEAGTHSCKAVGDPGKIEQVVDNLVSNAIKYTNQGHIKVSYRNSDEDEVTVSVEDTGIGISEEHLGRLFDRFYRTDKARSRDKGGTGLGLAVVKSILNAHGTDIRVESEVGKGSRFWFKLPAG
ncbi:HAMP domain-containing histidine kinase [Balneolaceae bacterium YR4-1]|uniref:histidine kinase n=1 Tax=Halalkalibaculum roseum TaxID=2709311 RepID=A0A6M1SWH0_9BACT|nr:HAMP domain-containing sensor histidine kinase [Halalkalibaculum roseum]NGP75384.1 HAMP domain-containing histidine kinase [Halalkalibaculum roseum]